MKFRVVLLLAALSVVSSDVTKDGSSIRRTRANQWKLQGESTPPSRGVGDESLGGLVGGWGAAGQVGCFDSVRFVVFPFRVFVGGYPWSKEIDTLSRY